jgi:hypothetical protein
VLDTLNRSLVGSESKEQDMTAYLSAADMLREAFGCAVAIVHHCGVESSRPRGHTSLTGAADAQLAVKRVGATSTVTVEYMKDGPEGDVIASRLEVVEVSVDHDGKPITSCVVVADEAPPASASEAKGHKLTPNQQSLLNILEEAGPAGLSIDEWNDKARENGLGTKRRMTLMDCRKALKDKRLIHTYADRWYVTHK